MWRGIWLEYAAMAVLNECDQAVINDAAVIIQDKQGLTEEEMAAVITRSSERLAEYEGEGDEETGF